MLLSGKQWIHTHTHTLLFLRAPFCQSESLDRDRAVAKVKPLHRCQLLNGDTLSTAGTAQWTADRMCEARRNETKRFGEGLALKLR